MIRELGRSARDAVLEGVGRAASRYQERKPLPVDLLENDEEYLAVFDAPGARSPDVDVRFDDQTVHVTVERFRETHEGFDLQAPGRGMSLHGSVELPPEAVVNAADASAVLTKNGTLEVHVPKVEATDPDHADVGALTDEETGTAVEPAEEDADTER